ncbi:MAG: hypothetical protein ACYC2P_08125 [Paludibacteraceae bacterium]
MILYMSSDEVTNELKLLVKRKFAKPLTSLQSFGELSQEILLSTQTLRRFFGKIEKEKSNTISRTSLSLICQYVGFSDWDSFRENFNKERKISDKDRTFIENMSVFFKNGKHYNLDYYQNTITVDTLNDYVKIIYANKENIEYFYKLYHDNNWASDYVFAWLPNYNFFGKNWFRKILSDRVEKTETAHVRLSQTNFLFLGAFLTKGNVEYIPKIENLKKYYLEYRKKFDYMPYHEMRYHTIRLFYAKKNHDKQEFHQFLDRYLQQLQKENLSEFHRQEMIIFLCNALIWMNEYSIAYELLKNITDFIPKFKKYIQKEKPMHYLGISMAFVKTTFALVWFANNQDHSELFELKQNEFTDPAGLLYDDYTRVMYLAWCILTENGLAHKKNLFTELKALTEKTGYIKIFEILEDLDPAYKRYFS